MKLIDESPFTGSSDLENPFSDSYLDSLIVESKEKEIENLSTRRFNIRLMTGQNLEVIERTESSKYSFTMLKPYDLQMDIGIGQNMPINLQLQIQNIKEKIDKSLVKRGILRMQIIPLSIKINKNLDFSLRTDGRYSEGNLHQWAWGRVLGSLQVNLSKKWNINLGVSCGKQFGKPHFKFDRPYSLNDYHFRLFYNERKYSLSYLTRYSRNRQKWYDHQVKIEFTCGAFEPYILYSSYSGSFNMGCNLRIAKLINKLN